MTMQQFETAVAGMADVAQWFPWRLEWDAAKSKYAKQPCTLDGSRHPVDASSPANWHDFDSVRDAVKRLDVPGAAVRYAMGFYLTAAAGYVLIDIDHAFSDGKWLPIVGELCAQFNGAMVERSSSGRGAHIIASVAGVMPRHRNKRSLPPVDLELYSEGRGVAFGLDGEAKGCADTRFDFAPLVARYFAPSATPERDHTAPAGGFKGSDDKLIECALSARVSAESAFNGKATFADLWNGITPHDSNADAALIAHLAFWCGPDEERIERLMRKSNLIRPKWDERRPGGTYLTHSIAEIVAKCDAFYSEPSHTSGEGGTASPTTDLANAHRLRNAHGQDMMHVPGIGWHVWEGNGPWQCDDGQAQRLAYGLGRIIQAEAKAMDDWVNDATVQMSDEQKDRAKIQATLHRWAKQSESRGTICNSLDLASKLPGMYAKADTLDANPLLVGAPSGVIDLTTGVQRAHMREDRITRRIAFDYDPNAKAPMWAAFVDTVMGGDCELSAYLQTICGYALSGERGEHMLPVFYGIGKNGKSTFIDTIQTIMGDYASPAAPGLLLARKGNADQEQAVADLRGRRLVISSESGENEKLAESRVKQITGGDKLRGRPIYSGYVDFWPTHLVILQTNHPPRVSGTDEGIWRRLKLVPFTVTIPENKRVSRYHEKMLAAEGPGILAWMVEGWRMYQQHGLREPEAVKAATVAYRSDSDPVGRFIDERCAVGPEHTSTSGGIYAAYKLWCTENGEPVMSQRALGLKLADRPGIEQSRSTTARGWRGLAVASYAELGHVGGQVVPLARKG